ASPPAAAAVVAIPADPRLAADLASFDVMWQRVHDSFYDPTFGGLDWAAVKTELRPKVAATTTREDTRKIMNEALERLGKSHFGVWGGKELEDAAESAPRGDADVGLDIRILGGAAIVVRVEAGSSATGKVGLGAKLVAIDDKELAPRLAAIAKALDGAKITPLLQSRAVLALMQGAVDSQVKLTFETAGKRAARVTLPRRPPAGRMVSLGNLGPAPLVYEARWLDKQVAYIRLSIFLDPATVVPAIARDLELFAKARGVIFDLRGNPGGLGGMAMGIGGHLISDDNKKLGTMRSRQTSLDFVINPQSARYAGKVAVLVDELSASTSEIFAGGLQDLKRARVFGRRTPGAALPSVIEELPNGDRFQYAVADYVSVSGTVLEGEGVTPDEPIVLDPRLLRAGKDPDVLAATRWIMRR
nr:S41 family peptidase [Myxococcota bacterium]